MTTAAMVFDIAVEPHCPDRVMRQFDLRHSSYFSARGPPPYVPMGPPAPMTFAPVGPAPQTGSYTAAEVGLSHVATPGMSYAIALSPCNIHSIPLFNID